MFEHIKSSFLYIFCGIIFFCISAESHDTRAYYAELIAEESVAALQDPLVMAKIKEEANALSVKYVDPDIKGFVVFNGLLVPSSQPSCLVRYYHLIFRRGEYKISTFRKPKREKCIVVLEKEIQDNRCGAPSEGKVTVASTTCIQDQ
jgi:hypothetical protein